jgi:predicted O-methyltransferase YrrM
MGTLTIDVYRAWCIEGWMEMPELHWLAEQAQRHSRIVELGSYQGRSTRVLGDHTPGSVIAIDSWQSYLFNTEGHGDMAFESFRHSLADLLAVGKVMPLRMDHADAAQLALAPDMVFIDGDHGYDAVCRDIAIWSAKLIPGGLLAGHDYGCDVWPDVKRAVDEIFPEARVVPGTTIWYVPTEDCP